MKNLATYVLLVLCSAALAQNDSTLLQEATVVDSRYASLSAFQVSKSNDSITRLITPAITVAEWLNTESSTHVRQYSPGSVASYSTRGANSAQNAILWSGFNKVYYFFPYSITSAQGIPHDINTMHELNALWII